MRPFLFSDNVCGPKWMEHVVFHCYGVFKRLPDCSWHIPGAEVDHAQVGWLVNGLNKNPTPSHSLLDKESLGILLERNTL